MELRTPFEKILATPLPQTPYLDLRGLLLGEREWGMGAYL